MVRIEDAEVQMVDESERPFEEYETVHCDKNVASCYVASEHQRGARTRQRELIEKKKGQDDAQMHNARKDHPLDRISPLVLLALLRRPATAQGLQSCFVLFGVVLRPGEREAEEASARREVP